MTWLESHEAGLTHRQRNLLSALEGLVPLFVLEMRNWTFERHEASLDIEAITCTADVLMCPSGRSAREESVRRRRGRWAPWPAGSRSARSNPAG